MRRILPILVLLLGLGCVASPEYYWVSEHVLLTQVDYRGWDLLLREHVKEGLVDYPAFNRSLEFRSFLDQVGRTRLLADAPREMRLAFLVNAYNARAIKGILDGGSPATWFGRARFFWRERHPVAGEDITLWDLEHERIRPFGDARIHFALVCASASCPRLASRAFLPDELDAQLEQAAFAFVNDPSRNRFDPERKEAHVSAIFEWYDEDFVAEQGSLAAYLAGYVRDPAVAADLRAGRYEIRFQEYDWSLNGQAPSGG